MPAELMTVQRSEFAKEQLEKEAVRFGLNPKVKKLTPVQIKLLERIRDLDKEPYPLTYPGTTRSAEQVAASIEMHKRVNPGYVDMPYKCSSQEQFKYYPPPDFSRAYLKKKSDCDFQGFANEAILKHVDLKKTSH